MRADRNKKIMIVGAGTAVILIAAFFVLMFFDFNSYKPKIETILMKSTGLAIKINGKLRISFIPPVLSAEDVKIGKKGEEILVLERISVRVELAPLLRRRVKITECEIANPTLKVIRDRDGKINFEGPMHESSMIPGGSFSIFGKIKISNGSLMYLDRKTGNKTDVKEINLSIGDFRIRDRYMMKNLSFMGRLECGELLQKNLRIGNINAQMKVDTGIFALNPITMEVLGGKGEGEVLADWTGLDPLYKFKVMISDLRFENLEELFGTKKIIGGTGDLSAALSVSDKKGRSFISNLDGVFALRGDNLVTNTMDLDKVLSKYETAQKFHPADLAVFFIVGPLGNIVIKEYRFRDLYNQTTSGQGDITQFISHWKIQGGEAEAVDCALATRHNRVALKGKLDLVNNRYDSVTVALLDNTGCPTFKQTINGSFDGPRTGPVSMIESLASPLLDIYRSTKRFVHGGACKVFYTGAVRQPH